MEFACCSVTEVHLAEATLLTYSWTFPVFQRRFHLPDGQGSRKRHAQRGQAGRIGNNLQALLHTNNGDAFVQQHPPNTKALGVQSLRSGAPHSACTSLMGVLPYRFSISVKSRSPCLCNSILFSCRMSRRLLTRDSMPAYIQEKSQRGLLTSQIPGWKQN